MPTSPQPFTRPNGQSLSTKTNPITQSPFGSITAGVTVNGTIGLDLLSSVCKDDVYSPALQIYDDGLTSQAPVAMSPTQAIVPAVTQSSPCQNCQTLVALFQEQSSRKRPACPIIQSTLRKNTNLGKVLTILKRQWCCGFVRIAFRKRQLTSAVMHLVPTDWCVVAIMVLVDQALSKVTYLSIS